MIIKNVLNEYNSCWGSCGQFHTVDPVRGGPVVAQESDSGSHISINMLNLLLKYYSEDKLQMNKPFSRHLSNL